MQNVSVGDLVSFLVHEGQPRDLHRNASGDIVLAALGGVMKYKSR